jgi:hypothetical protein
LQLPLAFGCGQVMYTNMLGCDQFGYDYDHRRDLCTEPLAYGLFAPTFFMTFVIIATFVMINLFVGVVTTSMEDAHQQLEHDAIAMEKIDAAIEKFEVSASDLLTYRQVYDLINTDGGE